ncbi:MAG: response regulator transcription factor [Legionellaceae bacterium]
MSITQHILIIEDNPELTKHLSALLVEKGFSVYTANEGETGLKMAYHKNISAILLELLLPKKNGLEVLQAIREQSDVPIITLSDSDSPLDLKLAFTLGADEFIQKPCDPDELLTRLDAVLRRANASNLPNKRPTFEFDEITVDCGKRAVYLNNKQLDLTNTEFNILETLIKAKGQAFSKEELTEYALGRKFTAYDRSIDVHISNLRNKLGNNAKNQPWVKTVRGFGYAFSD